MRRIRQVSVYLPHINYTIRVRPNREDAGNYPGYIVRDNKGGCTIYLTTRAKESTLAHELVHALAFICEDKCMDFTKEFEHMAYIMQYVMGKALGYVWARYPNR